MAVDSAREQEAKFQLSPDLLHELTPPTLTIDGYTTHVVGLQSHTDTYMDTPSFDLLRHGVALRIRRKGESFEAGIKSLETVQKGNVLERVDIAIPLSPDRDPLNPNGWPKEVEEHLLPYQVEPDKVGPIVIVHQERHKSLVSPTTSQSVLAEWSLDEVWITRPASEVSTTGDGEDLQNEDASSSKQTDDSAETSILQAAATHFHELEIERLAAIDHPALANGTVTMQDNERTFAGLVQQVQERYTLTPIYTSKLVRGLESLVAQLHNNHLLITATMEVEAAGRLLLHQQLMQILLNEHGVRAGKKSKYVHDMRVAIRRARAALQLCESTLGAKELAPHKKGLKRLGSALGAVRDLDVALLNLRDFKRSQPKSHQRAIKRLRKELKSQRALAHSDLMKLLDSKGYRKFIEAIVTFCITPKSATQLSDLDRYEVAPTQVRHTLPSIILHAFESMRAYEVLFSSSELPPLESIHAMRIQSKSVRYLLEFSKHLMANEGEILLKHLCDFQDHLGHLNDAHVEEQRLSQWAESMLDEEMSTDAIATRLDETRAQIDKLAATVPARLEVLTRPSTRKRLASALARI